MDLSQDDRINRIQQQGASVLVMRRFSLNVSDSALILFQPLMNSQRYDFHVRINVEDEGMFIETTVRGGIIIFLPYKEIK